MLAPMTRLHDHVLLHLGPGLRKPVAAAEIVLVEAQGEHTRIRLVGDRVFDDVRRLGDLEGLLRGHALLRVHRHTIVNLRHVAEIRRRPEGRDWELRLDPPMDLVVPIARQALSAVWAAYGPLDAES